MIDKDQFLEALLQERDELYQELSRLRQADGGELDRYEALITEKDKRISEKDKKISQLDEKVKNFEDKLKQLNDQLAWYRRKAQRKLDFEGLDILPKEEEATKEAAKEIITYERNKPEKSGAESSCRTPDGQVLLSYAISS